VNRAAADAATRQDQRQMQPAEPKCVYGFAEGSKEMCDLFGGKGANLAEMARFGAPLRVPAGFTP